jgi:hypothetical protein
MLTSIYLSLKGLLLVLTSFFILYILKNKSIISQINLLRNLLLTIFILGFLGSIITNFKMGNNNFLSTGTQGGVYTLFGFLYLTILLRTKKYKLKKSLITLLIIYIILLMNSISSLLSYLLALLFSQFKKNKIHFIISVLIISLISLFFFNKLNLQDFSFANKDLATILEGTGRFLVYEQSFKVLSDFNQGFFGVGFGAEHTLLEKIHDLPWAHTCHNSFLSLALGLGIPGIIFYVYIIKLIFYTKLYNSDYLFIQMILYAIFFYGITNSIFPGNPGPVILISITIYQIILNINNVENKGNTIC